MLYVTALTTLRLTARFGEGKIDTKQILAVCRQVRSAGFSKHLPKGRALTTGTTRNHGEGRAILSTDL